ncbi:MAG: hypothetical protein M1383_02100 [Patescibacteria group bacterium]|nr:hypothetical protein [Patescibacteria group bacterium]
MTQNYAGFLLGALLLVLLAAEGMVIKRSIVDIMSIGQIEGQVNRIQVVRVNFDGYNYDLQRIKGSETYSPSLKPLPDPFNAAADVTGGE